MTNAVTLKENREFRRLYSRGKSYVSPVMVTYVLKNRRGQLRFGITTSKKTGKAVQRNRSRRVIREAFRQLSPQVKPGYDLVFVARGRTPYVKCKEVRDAMEIQLRQAGVLE
ncbi:MAG: ribonuclease P protein component [Clostridiales bacterium]|jgi:ribonuclease P protein component|nr:ribonuclease P protein component [Clostridiales bacterium]